MTPDRGRACRRVLQKKKAVMWPEGPRRSGSGRSGIGTNGPHNAYRSVRVASAAASLECRVEGAAVRRGAG